MVLQKPKRVAILFRMKIKLNKYQIVFRIERVKNRQVTAKELFGDDNKMVLRRYLTEVNRVSIIGNKLNKK